MQETQVQSLGGEDPLEKEMATHSSILAWISPWTEEPGRLQSMGSQRVRHNLETKPPPKEVLQREGHSRITSKLIRRSPEARLKECRPYIQPEPYQQPYPWTIAIKKEKLSVARSCLTPCDPHGLEAARIPCPWNSPGKNTGLSGHALFQGIFLTQGLNLGLLHCR